MFPIAANRSDEEGQLYSDDVFSTYLYTGNGSTQTINNGIDLAGKGGMVWLKDRTTGTAGYDHVLIDTVRGSNLYLTSNSTSAHTNNNAVITGFNANGFGVGSNISTNKSIDAFVSWTFRKAAKFFDVVTYTGTGSARTIAHSLGVAPGMVVVKRTDTTGDWQVYHLATQDGAASSMQLNLNYATQPAPTVWNSTSPTSSVFSVGTDATVNASGGTYVAYLYANDTSSTGIIRCGNYFGSGNAGISVTVGWEPQFLLIKSDSGVTGSTPWYMYDSMRGMTVGLDVGYPDAQLAANVSAAESGVERISPTSTGFIVTAGTGAGVNEVDTTYIYMAIRRPNKPPTTGTQVYNAIARTGTGAAATVTGVGFAPDLVTSMSRNASGEKNFYSRLRGPNKCLASDSTGAELTNTSALMSYDRDGVTLGANTELHDRVTGNGINYINHFFKRSPGFFDEVCSTFVTNTNRYTHNLTVAPELILLKSRSNTSPWYVYISPSLGGGYTNYLTLNTTAAIIPVGTSNYWGGSDATATDFGIANGSFLSNGWTFVAYLFATLAGISKVGSYTGNGSSQNINCGFAAGARFVLIKCTSAVGAWYVWDTARGIVSANDPRISINDNGASEVTTDDSIDPYSAGFAVNQVAATNINVTSATYIYLAIS